MKKAFVLFALCLVLVLGAVSIAFFHLHQDRNQVTVTAETSEMHESLEEMMTEITAAEGVLKFEILAA